MSVQQHTQSAAVRPRETTLTTEKNGPAVSFDHDELEALCAAATTAGRHPERASALAAELGVGASMNLLTASDGQIKVAEPLRGNPHRDYYVLRVGKGWVTVFENEHRDDDSPDKQFLTEDISKATIDSSGSMMERYGAILSKRYYPQFWSEPARLEQVTMTTNGLVVGSGPVDDYTGPMPQEWAFASEYNAALAAAAAFEHSDLGEQTILIHHRYFVQSSTMFPLLVAQYEKERAAELAEPDPDSKDEALAYLVARALHAGIILGRQELGKRTVHGDLQWNNPWAPLARATAKGGVL